MSSFRNNPESKWIKFYLPFWGPAPDIGALFKNLDSDYLYILSFLKKFVFKKKIHFLRKIILTYKIVQV